MAAGIAGSTAAGGAAGGTALEISTAQLAIAWLAQQEGVSTVIPGARSVDQARANAAAGSLPALGPEFTSGVRRIYDSWLRADIHPRW